MSENSRTLDGIAKSASADLRAAGFTGSVRTLNRRTADGLTQVVGFQPGLRSMAGQFTVNTAIYVPEVARYTDGLAEGTIDEAACSIRVRLGRLGPAPRELWWPIAHEDRIVNDVRRRLDQDALPFLERFATRDGILAGLDENPEQWVGTPPRILKSIILAQRGDASGARGLLDAQIAQSPTDAHTAYVRELMTKLGL